MKHNPFMKLWGMPLILAVLSLAGLIIALAGDGIWDIFSWIGLGIPLYLIIKHYYFRKEQREEL
ncbi:hypothetical protein [Chitinophaga alhagiae]|uniref:hypothetical protein n=1 Tax=Chitinophaga alhagiae TaxID=2203219 RepID=UPI000E5B2E8B|nr:hypothetical protein [Chitinophaga alhagiae]